MSSMSSQWILTSCKYIREFSYSSPSCSVLLFPVTSSQALSYPSISYSVPYCLALSLFVLFCFVVLWRGVAWCGVSSLVVFPLCHSFYVSSAPFTMQSAVRHTRMYLHACLPHSPSLYHSCTPTISIPSSRPPNYLIFRKFSFQYVSTHSVLLVTIVMSRRLVGELRNSICHHR